jgi:transposase
LPADITDADGARALLPELADRLPRLERLWADGAYQGLGAWAERQFGWTVEIVNKLAGQQGFVPLPKRWIVEQVFGSLGRHRRLARDYEFWPQTAEAVVYIASIHRSLKRLTAAG